MAMIAFQVTVKRDVTRVFACPVTSLYGALNGIRTVCSAAAAIYFLASTS